MGFSTYITGITRARTVWRILRFRTFVAVGMAVDEFLTHDSRGIYLAVNLPSLTAIW